MSLGRSGMRRLCPVLLLVPFALAIAHAHPYHDRSRDGRSDAARLAGCPPQGDARWPPARALNVLKRRMSSPSPRDIDPRVTLAALLAPGTDAHRWSERRAATVIGYVAAVRAGGVESVNCYTHDPLYRDTHIELTLAPGYAPPRRRLIVEVTPQWRERMARKRTDWRTCTLRRRLLGRRVRITGWLLFDAEHARNSAHTAGDSAARIWRATAWEIHPVTAIDILGGRRPRARSGPPAPAPISRRAPTRAGRRDARRRAAHRRR